MKVLYLTDSLSDLDGVGRYAIELIRALEELVPSLSVEVLLARKHRPTSADVPARWKVGVALPPDYFFYMTPARFWASRIVATRRVKQAARGADLVHAIKDYPHNLVALDGARSAGKPCIATAHGTYTVQPLLDPRHRARALKTYAGFDGMISVSSYTRRRLFDALPEGALDPTRVHVVPNCVDADRYAEPRGLTGRPWTDKRFTLGIGETKERKGHHLAIAAWCRVARDHPELHHFVVGRRSGDGYEASLHALAGEAGVGDRLHFLGNVEEAEKIDLLQRAEAFVHTPVTAADGGFEGFGIVYLEAAASGTPSVGTRDSGAEDAVDDGVSGLLADADVGAVETALRSLVEDGELRARLAAAGPAAARRRNWRDNAERVLSLYRRALEGSG